MSARPNAAGRQLLRQLGAPAVVADALGERPDVAAMLLACCSPDDLSIAADKLISPAMTMPLARAMAALVRRELMARERLNSRQQAEGARFVADALFAWLAQSGRAAA